jgi:hypothetical protein
VLHAVVFAFVTRSLPRRTTIIAMRPPRWTSPKRWPSSVIKVMTLRALAATRSVRLLVLEDPLATQRTRVWKWPLNGATLRLDDPADPLIERGSLPSELDSLPDTARVIALTGVIDERKRVPLILDGWNLRPENPNRVLVIAGPQRSTVRACLEQHEATRRSDVVVIDRYLSAGESAPLIRRSCGLFVLFDGGLSSATLVSAAHAGRWAITAAGGRPAAVATAHGFGIESDLTPQSIRDSTERLFLKSEAPKPVTVRSRTDFGARIIERAVG